MSSLIRWTRCTKVACSDGGSTPAYRPSRTTAAPARRRGPQRRVLAPAVQHLDAWRGSPFYRMRETGESLLRRRLPAADETEFKVLPAMRAAGFTDYVAIINRFAAEGSIGEMDCVYSSWVTRHPEGFRTAHIAALQRVVPFLALAVKSVLSRTRRRPPRPERP